MVIEKRKGMKVSVVLAAMVVVIATAFVPIATAQERVTLDITPDTGIAGERAAYQAVATANPGYQRCVLINVTLPAGFGAIAPTGPGQEIATAELYGEFGEHEWYAKTRFESNSQDYLNQMNVTISNNGDVGTYVIPVDYGPGGGAQVGPADVGGMQGVGGMHINKSVLVLPTDTEDGYLFGNITIPDGVILTHSTLNINRYVRNPPEEGEYNVTLELVDGEGYVESDTATIHIRSPAALPALTPIGLIALVGLLSVVLVGATVRRKK
ncbi:hypothetical protein C5S36_13460 [Candidatus Methanophagaceae archaeon]|nr:hypothetical protein C5S36_13460 [Methanophagales archaeon]